MRRSDSTMFGWCVVMVIILTRGCTTVEILNDLRPEHESRLTRRYWGDEMSSCLEIYCFRYLNTRFYLKCLSEYCPDAILVLPTRRDVKRDPSFSTSPSVQYFRPGLDATSGVPSNVRSALSDAAKVVVCPASETRNDLKYCTRQLCYVIFGNSVDGNDVIQSRLDVATSICMQTGCASHDVDVLPMCILERCC